MGVTFLVDFSVDSTPGMIPSARGAGDEVYSDRQLVVVRASDPAGIRFAGEIDASNSSSVGISIAAASAHEKDIHIDVTQLMFIDISGIRAFVTAAEALPEGRRMLLHGMPQQLETVIRLVGWNRLPNLVVCECGSDD
jgi:anti-anti-sigma factor